MRFSPDELSKLSCRNSARLRGIESFKYPDFAEDSRTKQGKLYFKLV